MRKEYFSNDTIAAIATSLAGDGGVGIIRLSGESAFSVASLVSEGLEFDNPRYLSRIFIKGIDGKILDDGLGVVFLEGSSFTGEKVVEFQLHGGRHVLQMVLATLLSTKKCRIALPGEFSFRAVRNQKMTLNQARGIGALVSAKSEAEVKMARRAVGGKRIREFEDISKRLKDLLAKCELSIDFADQDVEVISVDALKNEIQSLSFELSRILFYLKNARKVMRGILVTICGAPNAGKSTLFNALLGQDRAIVSQTAGTTRDVITEAVLFGPYSVHLADTAGIRETKNQIEKEGIARAVEHVADSDVRVVVFDAAIDLNRFEIELSHFVSAEIPTLYVLNKADKASEEEVEKKKERLLTQRGVDPGGVLVIAASTQNGVNELRLSLNLLLESKINLGDISFLPEEFQIEILEKCLDYLKETQGLIEATNVQNPELLSASLRAVLDGLAGVVGETGSDEILNKIFSEFCIGK